MSGAPLDRLDELLPENVRAVVERETPIPSIAQRAAEKLREAPDLVRADIGQITGVDSDGEVLYGPPVGLPDLRALIAESWNGLLPDGMELDARNVSVCTGAAEGLSLLFRCFVAGKTVGLPTGHWENYRNGVDLAGGRVVVLDFFDENGALDTDGIAAAIRREGLDALVVNFPCNPTGAVLNEDEARRLAKVIEEAGIVCIADEVYARLRYDGNPPHSLVGFAPGNVVAVSSASKEYMLPGARVGYVVSARAELTDRVLRKLTRANTASPNVLGQRRLLEVLGADVEDLRAGREPRFLGRVRAAMAERRDRIVDVLARHGLTPTGRAGHRPEGTIFLMASLPEWWSGDDASFAERALEAGCVSAVPGSAFGIPGAVRISYGSITPEAIDRLDENLASFRASL